MAYTVDTVGLLLNTADITAIQAAIDTMDDVNPLNRLGVDTPNLRLYPADIPALRAALRANATSLDTYNLKLAAPDMTRLDTLINEGP